MLTRVPSSKWISKHYTEKKGKHELVSNVSVNNHPVKWSVEISTSCCRNNIKRMHINQQNLLHNRIISSLVLDGDCKDYIVIKKQNNKLENIHNIKK